jgi:ATPase family associated with various cellular activities (AAA)
VQSDPHILLAASSTLWPRRRRPRRADPGRQEDRHRRRPGPPVQGGQSATGGIPEGKRFFLNIKSPELLNKYVGKTERHIRLVFQRAQGNGQ